MRRVGWPCLWDRSQTTGETNCCIVQMTSKDILDRNARFLYKVETEQVQHRTAEQIEDAPRSPEETVEAVTLVPRERVQQRLAEKIGDVPQFRKETCEQIGVVEVPETASQDWRLQHTVEQAFVDCRG